MTRPELKTFAVVLGVALAACHRSSHVDTELAVLPTSPVVSFRRLTMYRPCVGSFMERTKCQLRGPPETSCIYGLVHTGGKPAPLIDCAAVSGWPGTRTDDDAFSLPRDWERSASGATFMIREPGVDLPFEYRHMEVPDAGLRVSVKLGSGPISRTHHIGPEGVFYSHESEWSEDAGALLQPLPVLLRRGFWSMKRKQRAEAWPVILRLEPDSAPVVLIDGYDEPDYDEYFASLNAAQLGFLREFQLILLDLAVERGSDDSRTAYENIEWILAHPASEPGWFKEFAPRAADAGIASTLLDPYLALRGDTGAASRICSSMFDFDSEFALSVLALITHRCPNVVELARSPADVYGIWNDEGLACTAEQAQALARQRLDEILPAALRVDAGIPVPHGCGPFPGALAKHLAVPSEMRRRYDRITYRFMTSGETCRSPSSSVLTMPASLTRRVVVDGEGDTMNDGLATSFDEGPVTTCEIVIDDRKRTVRVTGKRPPEPTIDDDDDAQ